MIDLPAVMDVPYGPLIDPDRRILFPGRDALPQGPGVYAWWETVNGDQDQPVFADSSRPVYLAAAKNLGASIEADATGIRASVLRRNLATAVADHLCLRAPLRGGGRPPLNKAEHHKISQWVTTTLLVSWSEIAAPEPYRQALHRALEPHLKP